LNADLSRLEEVLDDAQLAEHLETLLPRGPRPRQLSVRTLLLGVLCCFADDRPAHLTRVHRALCSLPEEDRRRLGVTVELGGRTHVLTYRQVEYTFSLLSRALAKEVPDGRPSTSLEALTDALLEASVPARHAAASSSLAIDWSDIESPAKPTSRNGEGADAEASWGHRRGGGPGEKDELFFGYYFSLATMVPEEGGPSVPELVRRLLVSSCRHDPVPAFVGVLGRLHDSGVRLGDVIADSGYAHRIAAHFALPLRRLGAAIVTDLHPHDRGPQGTFAGAICHNGNLYCPATPTALFELGPLAHRASEAETAVHDLKSAELARFKLGSISRDDADGYYRVACPAVLNKLRCPLRPDSMALSFERPEVSSPPASPPECCTKKSLTVPPQVNAKTRQRHDYPSAAHRRSYARRSAAERANSRVKDPATTDVARGWCRVMGLVAMTLFVGCALVVRNLAVADAFDARSEDQQPGPRRRRRRHHASTEPDGAASS